MKLALFFALIIGPGIVNIAAAAQEVNTHVGKQKAGVVSASGAYSLDDLSASLARKAEQEGASSYKIIAASGKNKLYGVAEIYK